MKFEFNYNYIVCMVNSLYSLIYMKVALSIQLFGKHHV